MDKLRTLSRTACALILSSLLVCVALASNADVVGRWQVTATNEGGEGAPYTLVVQEKEGTLTGTVTSDRGDATLQDVKFADGKLTFRVPTDDATYEVSLTVSNGTIEGTWKAGTSGGAVKGKKAQ